MNTISLWEDTSRLPQFNPLRKDIKTDVLIIGGGMAGILCAYMLRRAGIDYTLVEADRICSGITKNTTAKITSQHGLIYHKLLRRFGAEKTALYLRSQEEALKEYSRLCTHIDCDFETKNACVYTTDNLQAVYKELEALDTLKFPAAFNHNPPLPFPVAGAVEFPNQAQFHPLKFIRSIAANLNIYEQTMVTGLSARQAKTSHGTITADKIIVTTHFPFINKHGSYFMKMYQHRSYVAAFENGTDIDGMYVDENHKGFSFRNAGHLLLIGGGGHRTGKKGGAWEEIRNFASLHYPDATEVYHWAAQDCITLDDMPYIGKYSARTPDLYVATGFNKWGMTSSMVSAMLLTDLITGRCSPYAPLYTPSRSILRPRLAVNMGESSLNLMTPSLPRCPHLGCALKWNRAEHTWDCPCHGSRFDAEGHLIDNPSIKDLKKEKTPKPF